MEKVLVIGAGPAGLTAAWELTEHGWPVTVLEGDPKYVGGLARTVRYKDFLIDVGGHRFFSKSTEIEALWSRMLPNDLLLRPRKSRIYFAGRFVAYPLRPFDVFTRLGALEAAACTASYLKARLAPSTAVNDYKAWIVGRFGERLYRHFFETYTEKVWGRPCHELSADWAAQRIRTFSLGKAILHALVGAARRGRETTLIDSFRYPRKGPGMLWEACAATLEARGAAILMGERVGGGRAARQGRLPNPPQERRGQRSVDRGSACHYLGTARGPRARARSGTVSGVARGRSGPRLPGAGPRRLDCSGSANLR